MKYNNSIFKKRLSLSLSLALIASSFSYSNISFAQGEVSKHETVYVNLDSYGNVKQTTVSTWLKDSKFKENIVDNAAINNIKNVTSDEKPIKDHNNIIWNTDEKDVIYQGTTNKQLPISTKITYFLNGSEITPKDLIGKSGELKINIHFTNNTFQNTIVNGKTKSLATPFTVATAITFDNEKFSNLRAEHSKIFSDGNNQMLTCITFPGLRQSLDLDNISIDDIKNLNIPEDVTIFANVSNFELNSIAIAASPQLPDMVKDFIHDKSKIDEAKKDIHILTNANNTIKKIDPKNSIKDLLKDPKKTSDAKLLVDDLFKYYDLDKALIDILPKYVTKENIALYDKIKKDFDDADINYVLDNKTIRSVPDRIKDEQIQKSKILIKDYDEIKTFDMDRFDKALEIINAYDTLKPSIDSANTLYNKLQNHDKELDSLDKSIKYTDRVFDLIDKATNSSINSSLSQDDINVMLKALSEKKTKEYSYAFTSLLPENATDPLSKEQQGKLVYLIDKSMKDGQLSTTSGSQLMALVQTGYIPEPYRTNIINTFSTGIARQVQSQIASSVDSAREVLNDIKVLQSDIEQDMGYNYKSDLRSALNFANTLMPEIRYIRDQEKTNKDIIKKALDLSSNADDMKYFQYWANRAKDMKGDIDDNQDSMNVLKDLLNEYDDPKISYFYSQLPKLRDDMDSVRPIITNLNKDLDIKENNISFHKSPETVNTLLEIKHHLDNNKYIADTMKLALNDDVVKVAREMLEVIDRRDSKGDLDKLENNIDDMKTMLDTKDKIIEKSDNYNTFTGQSENMDSQVSFVMKTEDLTVDNSHNIYQKPVEEKKGFIAWVKSLFNHKK